MTTTTPTSGAADLPEALIGAIMAAAYDFRDAHISGSKNLKRTAHAELESTVRNTLHALAAGQATAAPAQPAAQPAGTQRPGDERAAFEQWSEVTNQGYDLARNVSGKLQTFESTETEHAWRGFFHGLSASHGQAPAETGNSVSAQADSVQEDAARYRLLRRGQHWSVIDGIGDDLLRAEALDAAVDAALKQGGAT